MLNFIHQPNSQVRLGNYLISHFQQKKWSSFRAAVAFIKRSGVRHIRNQLAEFAQTCQVKISVGIDLDGTSKEGLSELLSSIGEHGEIWVYHNENNSTFHPKVYLFKNDECADVLIGSGNLTEGGLFTNYEASLAASLNLTCDVHRLLLTEIENTLDNWSNSSDGLSLRLTEELIEQLHAYGYVPTEGQARERQRRDKNSQSNVDSVSNVPLFRAVSVLKAPSVPPQCGNEAVTSSEDIDVFESVVSSNRPEGFVMLLQQTDVGGGQRTSSKARRSPEIFIPLAARNANPAFWGWPDQFTPDPSKPGKMDRKGVRMRIGTEIVDVNMMTWPDKSDFRIRNERLRSAGSVNDVLRIEKIDNQSNFSYYVEVVPSSTSLHEQYSLLCTNAVRNSQKRWGYY